MNDLHYQSLSSVCRRIKSGELTSAGVVEHTLARIQRLDGELKAYALVLADQARTDASRLDQDRVAGKPLGALHGVPIGIKDLLFTAGVPTASGTRVMADFVPDFDATVVTRLKEAGAVIIGKTQLTEGAFGAHHPNIEAPVNPWNADHFPGVSSSGSGVAVAAGLAFGALGTDTGGSIRFPCACCGLVGLKPTYGRVSRYGAFALAESLDHIGPMTRTVEDAARLLSVIAGRDPNDATTLLDTPPNYAAMLTGGLEGLNIGIDWQYVSRGVDSSVVSVVREVLKVFAELGARITEVTMPATYERLVREWAVTCGKECAVAHAAYYPSRKQEYGPNLAGLIEFGRGVSEDQYQALEVLRRRFRQAFDNLLKQVDVFICPCMPSLPPTLARVEQILGSAEGTADFVTFTAPFNYSGHPTLTLPAGLSSGGLPESFQLVGRFLGEPTLFRAGSAFEQAIGLDDRPLP